MEITIKRQRRENSFSDQEEEGGRRGKKSNERELTQRTVINGEEEIRGNEIPFFGETQNLLSVPEQRMSHLPGSILRVRLEQFVTYDHCEFFPGPNMNMVIGPNGTGKSTIVCAIALGLGGAPSLLGRAKEISEFVKHGKESATIEIELQDRTTHNRSKGIVITRKIVRDSNASQWKLNGTSTTHKEILRVVKGFNIQVDNLCQFLPQDKVAEFAEMGPTDLLLATQKAAGAADMFAAHTKLIQLRKEQKEALNTIESDRAQLERLTATHETIKKEIEKYQQREGILQKIELYRMRLAIKRYEISKEVYARAKTRNLKASAAKDAIIKKQQPLKKAQGKEEKSLKEAEQALQNLERELKPHESRLATIRSRLENFAEESAKAKRTLSALRVDKGTHAQEIRRLEGVIRKIQVRIDAGPPDQSELPELLARIRELNNQIHEIQGQIEVVQTNQNNIQNEGTLLNQRLVTLNQQIRRLDNVDQQRMSALARYDSVTGQAMTWLEENRGLFKEHVFRPLILEVSVKDPSYADAVESCFNSRLSKAFLCQNKEDYDVFTRELIDRRKWRISVIMLPARELSSFRPPLPVDDIRTFGFHDYALGLIDAPLPVLVALCDQCHFHAVPVSLGPVRNSAVEESRRIAQYIAEGVSYRVIQSEYGARKSTVYTQVLRSAKFLMGGVDLEEQNRLQNQMAEVRQRIHANEESIKISKREEEKIRAKDAQLRKPLDEAHKRRHDLRRSAEGFKKLELDLDNHRRELKIKMEEDLDAMISEAEAEIAKLATCQTQEAQKLNDYVVRVVTGKRQVWRHQLAVMEARAKKKWVESLLEESDRAVRMVLQMMEAIRTDIQVLRDRSKLLLDKAQAILKIPDKELLAKLQEFGNDLSLAQLEDGLESERTRQRFMPEVSPVAMEQFKRQTKEMESLRKSLARQSAGREKLEEEILQLRNSWVPRITDLVKKISDNFSRGFTEIGCVGEVSLSTHEDYDRWGVDILVKFRETETLQVLTGQRQSGGEKSVSTIMYLMALQELACSPFRVVDEINQGMDPRNERMIHKQLVRVACKPNTAQYFLITPKLLSDLSYHPHMKVLCVFNGEWQPKSFDLRAFLAKGLPPIAIKRNHIATQE